MHTFLHAFRCQVGHPLLLLFSRSASSSVTAIGATAHVRCSRASYVWSKQASKQRRPAAAAFLHAHTHTLLCPAAPLVPSRARSPRLRPLCRDAVPGHALPPTPWRAFLTLLTARSILAVSRFFFPLRSSPRVQSSFCRPQRARADAYMLAIQTDASSRYLDTGGQHPSRSPQTATRYLHIQNPHTRTRTRTRTLPPLSPAPAPHRVLAK